MKIGLVFAAAMAALALCSTALAQAPAKPTATATPSLTTADYTEQRVGGDQVVTFPGDTLPGDNNSPYGAVIRRPPGVLRAGLLRPRMNFVSELLKSVENL